MIIEFAGFNYKLLVGLFNSIIREPDNTSYATFRVKEKLSNTVIFESGTFYFDFQGQYEGTFSLPTTVSEGEYYIEILNPEGMNNVYTAVLTRLGYSYTLPSPISNKYRFGFNGKENNDEIAGVGSVQDYGFRMNDTRLGRFFSIDPLRKKYPELTTYQFASNIPIDGIDQDGLEWYKSYCDETQHTTYTVKIKVVNSSSVSLEVVKQNMEAIANYVSSTYKDYDRAGERETYSTKVEFEFVDEVDREKDFYLEFVDKGGITGTKKPTVTGRAGVLGNTVSNYVQIRVDQEKSEIAETGAHEIGHTGGLKHENDKSIKPEVLKSMDKNNIMNAFGFGNTESSPEQMKEIDANIPDAYKTIEKPTILEPH